MMRFMTAFAWQHLVMEYGEAVFDEGDRSVCSRPSASARHRPGAGSV